MSSFTMPDLAYPMQETSGSVMRDTSGNGKHGVYSGLTLGVQGPGTFKAVRGDGVAGYASVAAAVLGNVMDFTPGRPMGFSWFFKTSDTGGNFCWQKSANGVDARIQAAFQSIGGSDLELQAGITDGANAAFPEGNAKQNDGIWHLGNLVLDTSAALARCYIDAVQTDTKSLSSVLAAANGGDLNFFRRVTGSNYLTADESLFFFWQNYLLTQGNIDQLFNGRNGFDPVSNRNSNAFRRRCRP